jgi:uncharacterized membrane protein
MGFLLEIAPLLGGWLMKMIAINQENKSLEQQRLIAALAARSGELEKAREMALKESPFAAWNRRILIFSILFLIILYVAFPLIFPDIPTAVPIVKEGFSFLGFQLTADEIEYQMVNGIVKYDEVFAWASMIVEFYFGAQLAKGRQ